MDLGVDRTGREMCTTCRPSGSNGWNPMDRLSDNLLDSRSQLELPSDQFS